MQPNLLHSPEPMKPFVGDDGKEYYAMYVPAWVYEALNPWPDIYKAARRQLRKINA